MIDSTSKKYIFDKLKMYFREPYSIKKNTFDIIINQPSVGDIMSIGEKLFYSTLYIFIGNPTMYRVQLWDMGIDWNKISDFELFCTLIKTINQDISKTIIKLRNNQILNTNLEFKRIINPKISKYFIVNILSKNKYLNKYLNKFLIKYFGKDIEVPNESEYLDIDFSGFDIYTKKRLDDNGEEIQDLVAFNKELNLEISESEYLEIREYLRTMFNIYPKVEKAKGKTTKEWMIEEDKLNLEKDKDKKSTSTLLPLISFCINHPGFKYKLEDLKDMGIVQFMDSVQRLQVYESTVAINSGLYSGMCDLSKVDKELFNFMREI